jgi:hypothetical protein
MLFLKLNRGKLHEDKNKSNVISIGDHIYPLDKTLSISKLKKGVIEGTGELFWFSVIVDFSSPIFFGGFYVP